jgi:flagellar hook protein FlgE
MSFQTGLSGLNAASKSLDVIGNNIANANTVGMKSSRAEFADLVASSIGSGGGGGSTAGLGVAVATVSQQFTQGNINVTGNNLDVAINGGGFFQVTKTDGSSAYTRDGQFKLDKDGSIITNTGANVMGYKTDLLGKPTSITPVKMTVPTGAPIAASATTTITAEFNLDARAAVAATAVPPTPRATYGTSLTAFDSQGAEVPVSLYFERVGSAAIPPSTAITDNWNVYDVPTGGTSLFQMQFDAAGKLTSPSAPQPLTIVTPSVVTPSITATLDVSKVTQFGSGFNVSNLTQNGYASGELTGITISPSGTITTRYSNGQTQARGQLSLAGFRNEQGLTPVGGGEYVETYASGQPLQGNPGIGKFGSLRAGAVEESNVDLTAELVNMMTAQRAYQANAQTIKTQDQVMSTLVNLR